jgi:hypothetical protein
MPVKESLWKKYMTGARDIIFILLFLASIVGWIRSETIKKTKLETQVDVLTTKVEVLTKQLEKTNDILGEQQILNGKIIYFLDNHNK